MHVSSDEHRKKYFRVQVLIFIVAVNVFVYTKFKELTFSLTGLLINTLAVAAISIVCDQRRRVYACGFVSGAFLWGAGVLQAASMSPAVSGAFIAVSMLAPLVGFFWIYRFP
jgi:hypothetical protein